MDTRGLNKLLDDLGQTQLGYAVTTMHGAMFDTPHTMRIQEILRGYPQFKTEFKSGCLYVNLTTPHEAWCHICGYNRFEVFVAAHYMGHAVSGTTIVAEPHALARQVHAKCAACNSLSTLEAIQC